MELSCCGKDCDRCEKRVENGCLGCKNMRETYWGEDCIIKKCCGEKKIENCGECSDFPCAFIREIESETSDERTFACKHILDEKRVHKEKTIRDFLIGISVGIIVGALIGSLFGNFISFVIAGIVIGVGIAFMLHIYKK